MANEAPPQTKYHGAMDPVSKPRGPVTGKDVAALAGVSAATVSRVLAGTRDVNPKSVRKVRDAARKLDYALNRVGRSLRVRYARTIGVLIPDIENPLFGNVVSGIESILQKPITRWPWQASERIPSTSGLV
jgi:transcriptional regulator with XRE-family HTH domain